MTMTLPVIDTVSKPLTEGEQYCPKCPDNHFKGFLHDGKYVKCTFSCCGNPYREVSSSGACPKHHWGKTHWSRVTPETPQKWIEALLHDPVPGHNVHIWPSGSHMWPNMRNAHVAHFDRFIEQIAPYPGRATEQYCDRYEGRGCIIPAGGKLLPSAYVTIRFMRDMGWKLPIEVWYLGRMGEMPEEHKALLRPYGVDFVDGDEIAKTIKCRILNGWELKWYAILQCRFKEILFLDADCYPIVDPTVVFDWPEYKETGSVMWSDQEMYDIKPQQWWAFGVPEDTGKDRGIEASALVFDKEKCWNVLQLAREYNDHSDYTYSHFYGDKETAHVAHRKLKQPYSEPPKRWTWSLHTALHHDFNDKPVFLHRCRDKIRYRPENFSEHQNYGSQYYNKDLPFEDRVWAYRDEYRRLTNYNVLPQIYTRTPKVAVVIGTYGTPGFIDLHLNLLKKNAPDVPVLVHDDNSPDEEQLRAVCDRYGAALMTRKKRGGQSGDVGSYAAGLRFAKENDCDIVVKFSRRFVPLRPWVEALQSLAMESQHHTFCNKDHDWNFEFDTRCFAMHVGTWWTQLGALDAATEDRSKIPNDTAEWLMHQLVKELRPKITNHAEMWEQRNRDRTGDGYAKWDLTGSRRLLRRPDVLWHDVDGPIDYARVAHALGISRPLRDYVCLHGSRDDLPRIFDELGLKGQGVEVGVGDGGFSEVLRRWKGGTLHLVDPWRQQPPDVYQDVSNQSDAAFEKQYWAVVNRFKGRDVKVHRKLSVEAAATFPDQTFDWVYIDANHRYASAVNDLNAWWPKVRPGGVLCGHDFVDGSINGCDYGVKSAVTLFAKFKKLKLYTTGEKDSPSWILYK